MGVLKFMSAEHVALMNALLAEAREVRAAAAALGGEYVWLYELTGCPDGATVYWSATIGAAGLRFDLDRPDDPADIVVRADWTELMRSLHAQKSGVRVEVRQEVIGDPDLLERLGEVLALGQGVATVETRLPAM
ncbi:hypothetical protein ACIBHX_20365 [Nonomuraea sp. NPDC050536]|uniref:hypothetical protein n=1 Tax=Nonomuraea sp. NPDC050536 TaxID=3364366 RepID=UPI0037C51A36